MTKPSSSTPAAPPSASGGVAVWGRGLQISPFKHRALALDTETFSMSGGSREVRYKGRGKEALQSRIFSFTFFIFYIVLAFVCLFLFCYITFSSHYVIPATCYFLLLLQRCLRTSRWSFRKHYLKNRMKVECNILSAGSPWNVNTSWWFVEA